MKTQKLLVITLLFAVVIASCKKDDVPVAPAKVTTGLYVLSEGMFNQNNSMLTYYSFSTNTPVTDFYASKNGSGLGDTGNDILLYGGKMYIVMNVSSYVEVDNQFTGASIQKIQFKTAGNAARQPRYAVPYKNKVLVSSYDGTVAVIDTSSLTIEKFITVGLNPEQMAVWGDKLYVANSGGLSPKYDSTLSVVDLTSFTQIQKITVGINPGSVAADSSGNIYVACTGDYGSNKPKLVKVSTSTNAVVKSADTAAGKIRYYNNALYATGGYLGSSKVRKLSTTDFSAASSNFVTDGTSIQVPYGLNIDAATGDVYVTDAKDYVSSGMVYCFDQSGKKKFSFSTTPAISPNTVAIIKQ